MGSSTTVKVPSLGGWYGLTAAPGCKRIGNGLSLLVDVYLPFWVDPTHKNGTYGFNLFVPSNTTAAILDAVLPAIYSSNKHLSKKMNRCSFQQISTLLCRRSIPSLRPSERTNVSFCQDLQANFGAAEPANDLLVGAFSEILAGSGDDGSNFTEIYVSFFNTTKKESFNSTADRYLQTRRRCLATWNITRTTILMSNATILQSAEEARATEFQQLIYNNGLDLYVFSQFLGEYAPTIREAWRDPLPYSNDTHSQYTPAVNTVTPLVAAMLWARIVSANGIERPNFANLSEASPSEIQYWRDPSQITTEKEVVTVRTSPWLIFILAIHPVLTAMAVLIKALL